MSRRRDSNPEPPDYKGGAIRLIWPLPATLLTPPPPTTDLKPRGLTPFRVTNHVTPDRIAQGEH